MRFLVVDDEPEIVLLVRANVRAWGHECLTATTVAEGFAACCTDAPDVLLLDVAMPDEDGASFLGRIRDAGVEPRDIVLLSAIPPRELAALAVELGVRHLSKPFTASQLREAFRGLTEGATA